MMSKRRRSDDDGEPRSRRRRRHLHLVVDDWAKGFSIHKVDVSGFHSTVPAADLDSQATSLPGPPVFRPETPNKRYPPPFFAAVGSRIGAVRYRYDSDEEPGPTLLYDTATGGLAVGPCFRAKAGYVYDFVPAYDRLYALGNSTYDRGTEDDHFEVLAAGEKEDSWAWTTLREAAPPFHMWQAVCHAAHPDGRTIFFSVARDGTYSFDTETREWRRHGDWELPFQGRACYDPELEAWVGLHQRMVEPAGRICSCAVVDAPAASAGEDEGSQQGARPPPPVWKLAREELVCEDTDRTRSVALARIGRGRFCLVEHRSRKGVPADVKDKHYLFYMTTFRLCYDKDGELRAKTRRTCSYMVPWESNSFNWRVFGI